MNENFIDLDFYHGLPSHSFVDKKCEVRVNLGRPSTIPPELDEYHRKYGDVLLGIQQSGMNRSDMDSTCNLLALNCQSLGIELVVTKSDRPFDSQWYFFGDIEGLLKAARDETVRAPFSISMHEHISRAIGVITKN